MSNRLRTGIGIVILLIIGAVVLLLIFSKDFRANFASDFLASLIGVFVGASIAIWLDRYREEGTRKAKVEKMLVLLGDELLKNKKTMSNWHTLDNSYWAAGLTATTIKDNLWRAFSDGGELEWITDLTLLDLLATAYYGIRSVRELATLFSTFSRSELSHVRKDGNEFLLPTLNKQAARADKAIEEALNEISKHLGVDVMAL